MPIDMKVLMNHIYEYKKGVRQMILFTMNKRFEQFATERLQHQNIPYILQPAGKNTLNLYFGRRECLEAIRLIVTRPLNELTPEKTSFSVPCSVMTFVLSANVFVSAKASVTAVIASKLNNNITDFQSLNHKVFV